MTAAVVTSQVSEALDPAAVQAVFCVCCDASTIETAAAAAGGTPGFFFAGAFADYIADGRRPQFPPAMKAAGACVALIDFDADPELAVRTTERLSAIFPKRISIVAVGTEVASPMLLRAIRAGCVEYLAKPVRTAELVDALRRFEHYLALTPPERNSTGRVLAFFGAKGGVGTTTLAVHLATHLALTHERRTLVIDHKHQLGHVALYLGLVNTRYHFDELLRNLDRLDAELLQGYVLRHASGLDVLASPDHSTEQHECGQQEMEHVMDFLRREYDFVLIDSAIVYESARSSLIDQADEVYLVSTADVASLRDLARLVEHVERSGNESKVHLAINRSTANQSVTAEQIRHAVRTPVEHSIPNNYMPLLNAINHGEPVPPGDGSPFSAAMAMWAAGIVSAGKPVAQAEVPVRRKRFALWR